MYVPATGRFLSRDRVGQNEAELLYDHAYVYARNNPLNRVDPSGEDSITAGALGLPEIDCQKRNQDMQTQWENLCRRGTQGTIGSGNKPCFGDDPLGRCLKQLCESTNPPIRIECHDPAKEKRCTDVGGGRLCGFVDRSEFELGAACFPAKPKNKHDKLIIHICLGSGCGPYGHTLIHELVHLCSMPGVPGQHHEISEGCERKCYQAGGTAAPRGDPAKCCCPKIPVIILPATVFI